MSGLDERIAHLGAGGSILLALAIALLLGLRHATDPDHLTAVSTLALSDDRRGARRAGLLGLAWGLGHATTLALLGLPLVLLDRELAPTRGLVSDGCADIAHTADAAAHRLLAAVTALHSAAARGDRGGFSRELGAAAAENANLDLGGALDRLPILCAPRPSAPRSPYRST